MFSDDIMLVSYFAPVNPMMYVTHVVMISCSLSILSYIYLSETPFIAAAIYNVLFSSAILVPIVTTDALSRESRFIVRSFGIMAATLLCQLIIVIPKMYHLIIYGDVKLSFVPPSKYTPPPLIHGKSISHSPHHGPTNTVTTPIATTPPGDDSITGRTRTIVSMDSMEHTSYDHLSTHDLQTLIHETSIKLMILKHIIMMRTINNGSNGGSPRVVESPHEVTPRDETGMMIGTGTISSNNTGTMTPPIKGTESPPGPPPQIHMESPPKENIAIIQNEISNRDIELTPRKRTNDEYRRGSVPMLPSGVIPMLSTHRRHDSLQMTPTSRPPMHPRGSSMNQFILSTHDERPISSPISRMESSSRMDSSSDVSTVHFEFELL